MDKIKTLSEAIALGATFRPQCTGYMFFNGATCALGAASEAIGVQLTFHIGLDALEKRFPYITSKYVDCPECGDMLLIKLAIIDLNDNHFWTREQIASWLQDIEKEP